MHILVATGIYPPEIGGPATYTVLLEQRLPKYGHTVAVLPFAVSRHLPKIVRHIHYTWRLYRQAKNVDVIFSQDVASVGLPALLVARLRKKVSLVRVPGDYAWEQSVQRYGVTETIDEFQKKSYGFKVSALRFVQTCVTKYADQVITPSNYFRELVASWGVSKDKITAIYNGVDLTVIPEVVSKPDGFTIVSAGRLVPWKGFETLFHIMKEHPSWRLVILGDGPERDRYKAMLAELHIEDQVQLMGAVPRVAIFGWCKAADVFVLNTEFESFSYQIVEAMCVGAAIVTTKVGSIPELITDGVEGLLCEPNDVRALTAAIKSVVSDQGEWEKRRQAAKEKAQTFSITCTVEALTVVLKRYE